MKKSVITLFVFILLICTCSAALAQGSVSDMIAGDQDMLLLASVEDITDTTIILDPYDIISAEGDDVMPLLDESIVVDKFQYSYCADHSDISLTPVKGNNVFISLNRNGSRYTVAHGAYRVSSLDYRLLTFHVSESMKGSDCLADIVALANFVRSNGNMQDFHFENGTLTAKAGNKTLTLYPTDNITEMISFVNNKGEIVDAMETKDIIIEGESAGVEKKDDYRWIASCVLILMGVVIGAIVVYNASAGDVKSSKDDKKETK